MLCFEEYEHAKARNARILAEVLGFGYYFDPFRINKYNPKGIGIINAMRNCLEDTQCDQKDIDYISANANSTVAADKIETMAIKEVFGKHSYKIPVSAVKSMIGECYSATGAFQAAAGVRALKENFIPPTVNYKEPDPDCDLDYVPNKSRKARLQKVLVNTFGPNGSSSCMILGRY